MLFAEPNYFSSLGMRVEAADPVDRPICPGRIEPSQHKETEDQASYKSRGRPPV